MDPLSITTSVITLLGAARNVYEFLQSIRHADRGLQLLVREVSTLNGFLHSIDKALEDCRGNPYALTHIDPALWKESKIALSDCQETINQLGAVFKEPKRPSRSNSLFRRARVAAELRSRAGDIASFREKIAMSNLSLQTLLQVINVSLALRSNESHDTILKDLNELKEALKKSSEAATVSFPTLFLNEQDTRLVHHLKGLIRAAQEFHSSASTTASTVAGGTQPPPTDFGDDDSKTGIPYILPSIKRQQIETYLSEHRRAGRPGTSASSKKGEETMPSSPPKDSEVIPDTRDVGSSHMFSTIFTSGFSKIAQRALQELDLQKAEGLLREALKWYISSGSDDVHHQRHLQTQLILCNLLQGNRQEAEDLILRLVDSSMEQDAVVHQLLYALALLQLHDLDFQGARDNSKRLWEALQRTPHCTGLESNHAMRLLATSYQQSGDSLLAEAIEAELPDIRLSEPVPRMVDFLVGSRELLVRIFGFQGSLEASSTLPVVDKIYNLPIARTPSSLQMQEQSLEDIDTPVSESVPNDGADSGLSETANIEVLKGQPKPKKRSWSNVRAFFRPRLNLSTSSVDLNLPLSPTQHSPSKLRKRIKVSHVAPVPPLNPKACDSTSSVPDTQNSNHSSQIPSIDRDSEVQDMSGSHTADSVTDGASTDIVIEVQTTTEEGQSLKRQFSFQEGVPDCILKESSTSSSDNCVEMPNNAVIFELMDTSYHANRVRESQGHGRHPVRRDNPRRLAKISKRPRFDSHSNPLPYSSHYTTGIFGACSDSAFSEDTYVGQDSMNTMDDIYKLLGYDTSPSPNATNEQDLVTSNGIFSPGRSSSSDWHNATTGGHSSGSDSDISSIFDQVTPATRQTSFDSSVMSSGLTDDDSSANEAPLRNVGRMKSQRATTHKSSEQPPAAKSIQVADNGGRAIIKRDFPLNALHTRAPSIRETDAVARGTRAHERSRRDFGPAVVRLCRYRSPRKTISQRRPPAGAAAGLRKIFHGQSRRREYDHFDFGFNKARYFGPDAVVGPFTDLDENVDCSPKVQNPRDLSTQRFSASSSSSSSSETLPDSFATHDTLYPWSPRGGIVGEILAPEDRTSWMEIGKPPAGYNLDPLVIRRGM